MSTRNYQLALLGLLGISQSGQAQQTVKYAHTDALGSVVARTDAGGNVLGPAREYEPYGQQLSPAIKDGPGYTGHVQDAATGLTYMQQRYYDPQIGVFLSVDPVSAHSQPIVAFNRYRYAASNPCRFVDPDGMYICSGSDRDCANFDRSMGMARDAAGSSNLTTQEQKALGAAIEFFGEKGDPNVRVSFGEIGNGAFGSIALNADGTADAKFDLNRIADKSPRERGLLNGLAMRLGHEGDHGVRSANPASRQERMEGERSAYRVEAYYQKATGFLQSGNNLWAPWNSGDGVNSKLIEARARFSVDAACVGSAHGSCQ